MTCLYQVFRESSESVLTPRPRDIVPLPHTIAAVMSSSLTLSDANLDIKFDSSTHFSRAASTAPRSLDVAA